MPPHHQTTYQITPWRSPQDLLRVRDALYTPRTPQEQSHAISTITAWKLRGNVPHAVESTALLMDAMLLHTTTFAAAASTTSTFALKSTYTTALSRFVTGLADLGRHRSGPGQSMFDVARGIGLPSHFVELRHEVAHEEMPSLGRLVGAAQEAVEWLWGVYWGRLGEAEVGLRVTETDGQVQERSREVVDVLKGFRGECVRVLKTKGKVKAGLEMERLLLDTQKRCQGEGQNWDLVASVLVDQGLIIPSLKGKRGPLSDSELQGAYMIWDDLLQMFASGSPSFTESFFEKAVAFNAKLLTTDDTQDNSDASKWAIYRWILHLLKSPAWEKVREESQVSFEVMVLRECVLHPNKLWSQELGEEILEDASDEIRETWEGVLKASVLGEVKETEDAAPNSETADVAMEDAGSNHGGWRWETGSWKAVPIGTVAA